ncbi:MAG: hypothetical protein ABIK73_07305 [candidate division WOR-3 bacterium]
MLAFALIALFLFFAGFHLFSKKDMILKTIGGLLIGIGILVLYFIFVYQTALYDYSIGLIDENDIRVKQAVEFGRSDYILLELFFSYLPIIVPIIIFGLIYIFYNEYITGKVKI